MAASLKAHWEDALARPKAALDLQLRQDAVFEEGAVGHSTRMSSKMIVELKMLLNSSEVAVILKEKKETVGGPDMQVVGSCSAKQIARRMICKDSDSVRIHKAG